MDLTFEKNSEESTHDSSDEELRDTFQEIGYMENVKIPKKLQRDAILIEKLLNIKEENIPQLIEFISSRYSIDEGTQIYRYIANTNIIRPFNMDALAKSWEAVYNWCHQKIQYNSIFNMDLGFFAKLLIDKGLIENANYSDLRMDSRTCLAFRHENPNITLLDLPIFVEVLMVNSPSKLDADATLDSFVKEVVYGPLLKALKEDNEPFIRDYFLNPHNDINEKIDESYFGFVMSNIFQEWIQGVSIVEAACLFGSVKCFKYLTLIGAEITDAACVYACASGNPVIIHLLEQEGHKPSAKWMEAAIRYHRHNVVNWLIERDVPLPSLERICCSMNLPAFFFALSRSPNLGNSLFYAIDYGLYSLARFLINDLNADVNVQIEDGRYPIHSAAENCCEELCDLLLEKGANINSQDVDGETPLSVAGFLKHEKMFNYLLSHGANPNIADFEGVLPALKREDSHEEHEEILPYIYFLSKSTTI